MKKSALETVLYYKEMEQITPNSGMLREVKMQYADMASGGNGGELGLLPSAYEEECGEDGLSCRDYNYPGYPDTFFQEVCALMGWPW